MTAIPILQAKRTMKRGNPLINWFRHPCRRTLTVILPLLAMYFLATMNDSPVSFLFGNSHLLRAVTHPVAELKSFAEPDHMKRGVSKEGYLAKHIALGSRLTQKLPECARSKGRASSFLFIFMGHSGSTAIISELRSHPEVHIEASEPVDHGEYAQNTTLALQYAHDFFERTLKRGKTSGFKIRPRHILKKPEEWAALVRKFDTRIVWQNRNNILKQAVGEYSSKYLNDKASIEGLRNAEEVKNRCNTGVGCRFKIKNIGVFHDILKDCLHSDTAITRAVNLVANGSSCIHALPYEDYLYERETTMKNLQKFLGLHHTATSPSRFKATRDNLCDLVVNWKELCENFYGCHVWRHMFDDLRNGCYCEFTSGHVRYCDTI